MARDHPRASTTPGIEVKGPAARLVANMEESLGVPTATTFRQLGVATLEARRAQLNASLAAKGSTSKISFTHLIGYAIVRAVAAHPVMGHSYKVVNGTGYRVVPDARQSRPRRGRGAEGRFAAAWWCRCSRPRRSMDFAAFHRAYEAVVEKARTNKLMPDDFAGATVTLTNPGDSGLPRRSRG